LSPKTENTTTWLVTESPVMFHPSNNVDNFGMQLNKFRRIQLDSHSGQPISAERFWIATVLIPFDLKVRWVFEVAMAPAVLLSWLQT